MRVKIRTVGSSKCVALPRALIIEAALEHASHVEVIVEHGAIVLRKPATRARIGWVEAAREIGAKCDDELVLGEFGNKGDSELAW